MFHYSGRLAGLDEMVLKISAPSKIASTVSTCTLDGEPYLKVRKVKKRKAERASRPPLADKTLPAVNHASIQLPHAPSRIQCKSLEKPVAVEKPPEEQQNIVPPNQPVTHVNRSRRNIESFRPLPPLSSASTLQLPSFLNFSTTHSLTSPSPASQCRNESSHSLPANILFRHSSSHISSTRRVVVRKTKNTKVYEGPHWIPAFHHPNSPYVPWSPAVRHRILPPLIPESPISPLYSRSGAVAPEPWGSHSTTETQTNVEKGSSSWKSFKKSVKSGLKSVKSVVSRIGKVPKLSRGRSDKKMINRSGDPVPSASDYMMFAKNSSPLSPGSLTEDTPATRVSFGSLVSSDSVTLAAWLAERHTTSNTSWESPGMSVEEYEMMGSWLDLRVGDGERVCGVLECTAHTPNGTPDALCHGLRDFHSAVPFDATVNEHVKAPVPKKTTSPVSTLDLNSWPHPGPFYSLPRLPSQVLVMSTKELKTLDDPNVEHFLMSKKSRELSMPGGWAFTS
ncbi:uncharacterized protein BJ212DRAFT_1475489 [Suillus subaureus]|uniref:Uncharacterized protein n=1 Tax=Suillus subaureus TaxID=48587 RepID=A0A9P7JJL7_9AGAM|nr:uncharacterized protein BJ212DRAFT_1475489 [Suillus subaureus]KAG1826152.1 hypothetical protein BJ212DRAFT_1475489 [Suillus subaureus]